MIVTLWLNGTPDPHYGHNYEGGRRVADWSEIKVAESVEAAGCEITVITDCLADHPDVEHVHTHRVASMGGNPYFDRWRQLRAWLTDRDDAWIWSTDANDVTLLNDPYPGSLDPEMLYVGSEPADGPNARSVGFWWMRNLHLDHTDWIASHAPLPLLNAGLLGGTPATLREFIRDLTAALEDCPNDVTDMAAVNRVIYDRWADRYVTGGWHTPMWSFETSHPTAIWAHK